MKQAMWAFWKRCEEVPSFFQGQEAEVVLVSMTTSTAEDIARRLEFLSGRK